MRLFQFGYPKVWRLLEDGAHFRPGTYQRKYRTCTRNTRNLRQIYLQNHFDMLEFSDWRSFRSSNFQQLFKKKVLKRILCTTFFLNIRTVVINKILLHRVTLTNSSEILSVFAKITAAFNKLYGICIYMCIIFCCK